MISTVTLAELSVGPLVTDDAASARAFGRPAAGLRRSGRETRPRALDVLIAAVAVANDLPL